MPAGAVDLAAMSDAFEPVERKNRTLQEVFLSAVQRDHVGVTMFLVNGVMLQGEVAAYDLFCMLLRRDSAVQLVYKHAISTIQPLDPLNLNEETEIPAD
jgi:host factor-I protein